MTRRCSHCSHNGHNSRTCPNRGVKLFGVRLTDESIRKSASMGNLSHFAATAASGAGASPADGGDVTGDAVEGGGGYASEDFAKGSPSSCRERKRGVAWTEEEHRMFLLGLQKLGKGDWRGISRNFVISRTPTQVASHAQKYFIRQTNMNRRKRRSSLFDIVADEPIDDEFIPANAQDLEAHDNNPFPAPPTMDEEHESMDSNNSINGEAADLMLGASQSAYPKQEIYQMPYPVMYPAFFTPVFPYSLPPWPVYSAEATEPTEKCTHEVFKPTPVHSKAPINVDELLGMSTLSIGESAVMSSSQFTRNMLAVSERPSAFHANPPSGGAHMKSSTNPIQAV